MLLPVLELAAETLVSHEPAFTRHLKMPAALRQSVSQRAAAWPEDTPAAAKALPCQEPTLGWTYRP